MAKLNFIDKAISFFSPSAGAKRMSQRVQEEVMKSTLRRYEAAADGRRHSSWLTNTNPSVNLLISKDHKKIVSRSRELAINNGYAKKAPYEIANSVVGTGILSTPFIVDKIENGKIKQAKDKKKLTEALQLAFNLWAEDKSCDYNSDFNFYGLQHLCFRTIVTSGEVLALRRRVKAEANSLGFQILVLEADFIDTSKHSEKDSDGGYTFYGIKYDKENKRSGYWIFERHPSEASPKSNFIDIKDIIHVYDVERTGQSRGVPFAASSILTQKDLADYMDAELLAKKGAACFSAIVQKPDDHEDKESEEELENLEPGTVQYLNPGETIHFPTLPQNPGLKDFVSVQQRGIAAGYLMPYESLTGDFSQVNFSSARMGYLSFQKQIAYWQFSMFITKFCDGIFNWFVEGYKIAQGIDKEVVIKSKWTTPRREMIDPGKEIKAMKEEVRGGFASWSEKVKESGYDPKQVFAELAADQKMFMDANLMPDWTPAFELMAKVLMNKGKGATADAPAK